MRTLTALGCGMAIVTLAFAITAPVPVQATPAASFVRIDESAEGALPTITVSPAISSAVTTSVTPVSVGVGEEWAISISFTVPLGDDVSIL